MSELVLYTPDAVSRTARWTGGREPGERIRRIFDRKNRIHRIHRN
jgi:hypothetical protein